MGDTKEEELMHVALVDAVLVAELIKDRCEDLKYGAMVATLAAGILNAKAEVPRDGYMQSSARAYLLYGEEVEALWKEVAEKRQK